MRKGRAIQTAIDSVTGDIGITQDVDQCESDEYFRCCRFAEGHADTVYGSRFRASEQRRVALGDKLLMYRLATLSNNQNRRCVGP